MAQEETLPIRERVTEAIASDFTMITWVLIPIGVGLNAAGGTIANLLKLPVFLDNFGSLFLAIVAGPWAAALTAIIGSTGKALLGQPTALPFMPVPVGLAIAVGYLARHGWFDNTIKVIVPALVATVIATILSSLITVFVFGGATGVGADLVTSAVLATGQGLLESVFTGQIIVNLVDKGVLTFAAYFVARLIPPQYLPPLGQQIFSNN